MVEKKKKNLLKVILIFFIILLSFSYLYVKAFLNSDTSQIVPPDSFIQSGNVITIIEEDEKYYRKVETFNDDGSYSSPAMETQITYDEYAQIRSNSEYDILEKRNRHIINDIYVDEYYKAYSNGEIMAGNYVAEVLDGYFVPVEFNEHKSLQRVLINDGGVFYLATFNYDSEGNYAGPAMYLLISEDDYNSILIDEDYDYVKDVQWEISYDGNTIIKTISYYDKNDDLIMRPIVLQLTGFDSLEEYLNPNNIPNADENKPEENPNGDNGNNSEKNNGGGNGGSQSETQPEPPWTGTTVETKDDPIEWQGLAEWVDEANDDKLTGEGIDGQENQIIEGFYDDAGNFIEVDNNGNITPSEPGHFDENSNFIPEGGEGYYDSDGIWHPSDETEGKYDENGNFEINGEKIDPEGNIIPDENIISDENGHYDENGNFIENKGNIIDKDGIIHKDGSDIEILDTNGRRYINPEGLLTLDFYGRIVAFGKEGYYDEHGLIHLDNGTVGYYNADGKFTESRQNPYNNEESKDKGFYDVTGEFHSFNTIYKTENDTTNLILYPNIQLETDGLFIKIPDSSYQYSDSGLINNNGKKGYFNQLGDFIKSDKSAFKGGFYDEFGRWIDDSLYRLNAKNEIELSLPYFDSYGLFISPNKDRGYFNEQGKFIINKENPYEDGYYRWNTKQTKFGEIYLDSIGNIHKTGSDEVITSTGQVTKAESRKGILDKNKNWFNSGITITPDSKIGHYNEFKEFKEGQIPYLYGYYDSNGYFYRYDGLIISPDGKVGYYDENGNWVDGVKNATLDENGNWILPNGTVVLPDGTIGYYDENGVFHEGENPYTEKTIPFGAQIDENGNIIMPDGTVINGDGIEGYYDENGVFHEGENPYTDGYYDSEGNFHSYKEEGTLDSNGNIILSDGTVVNKDGVKGYYDENGVFHEGENPYTNGYYDENGVWHDNTENPYEGGYYDSEGIWHSYEEEGTLDSNGNIILSDGTVVNKDGVKGYYDENGVFHEGENPYENGYYDENGIWHSLGEENIKGYYDSEGNWQEQTLEGYIDKNGNKVLPNGVIVSKDGEIGYYDENGVFHEGENPYENGYYDENGVWHSYDSELPEGAYFDEKGNLIMSDGTVISKDGEVGYYDKNGVFHEGENPYENGYYDENGVWHESGYYDAEGNYIMSDGTIVMPDGTVILPDGTVVSGYVDENGKLIITENLNGDSYYDEKGNLIKGINPDMIGHYDADGNYYVNGDTGFYDESGTYHNADGTIGYYDENGVWHEGETNPYVNGFYDSEGNWHGNSTLENVQGYYDENGVFHEGENPYTDGYYDENGIWHNSTELGTIDENGNIVMPNGTVFKDGEAGYYDENGVWHKGTNPYEDGYYDSEGNWHSYDSELPEGAYFDKNGNLIMPDGTIIDKNGKVIGMMGEVSYPTDTPLVGYYDENGNFITGVANPYEGGYYDSEGNWHSDDGSTWIDKNGNVHKQDEGIGYYDSDGNFHLNGDTGYYDSKGTYHNADGTIGYYDKDGVWHEGEINPYAGGYYDSEGNWHPEGDTGYFDKDGNWHDNVSDTTIGYYDENGVFHEGINPYTNGYYDENGVWHGEGEPQKAYYNEKGELIQGTSPYEGGYYDSEGNWHPLNEEGFYDKNGTFHGKDGSIGYYDADGIWHEGTNPYEGGYYDSEGNWHPLGDTGYYDVNGTYYNSDGTFGYYDADGIWHEGQENPYTDGWYDSEGNFHPYGEDGYYDKDGVWHDILLKNSKYEYGNSQYILFTGTWRTSTENAALRLAGNTVQFTVNKHAINKLYSDTGIYVALNSILEYEEAKDIIHNIAITTGNTFIQDTNSCAIIYNERLIPIRKDEKISVKTLQKLFENTNIDITVAKTRIGKKYVLVEAIESNQKIKLKFDDLIITPKHPLTVINNEAYVSLTDVSDIIFYDFALKPAGKERKITFTLKKTIPYEDLRNHFANKIIMTTEDGTINYSGKNTQTKIEILQDICPTVITLDNNSKATYIPIKLIPRLTGCDASFETETYTINFNYNEGIPFMKKYYDLSNELNSEKPIELEETNIGRVQSEMDNKKTNVDKNTVKNNNVE